MNPAEIEPCNDCGKPARFRYWESMRRGRRRLVTSLCEECDAAFRQDCAKQTASLRAALATNGKE